jgi:hypothetical protein
MKTMTCCARACTRSSQRHIDAVRACHRGGDPHIGKIRLLRQTAGEVQACHAAGCDRPSPEK